MSALGQKQTLAVQQVLSALLPIATAKADSPKKSCLLYPPKRTCAVRLLTFAKLIFANMISDCDSGTRDWRHFIHQTRTAVVVKYFLGDVAVRVVQSSTTL
jgi:hypothetical protein